jgi:hypothetical protein
MTYGNVNVDTVTTSTAGGILGAGNASIMKNRIINGAMVISQYNGTSSATTSNLVSVNIYALDRWQVSGTQNSKFTIQQNAGSVTPPTGFTNYYGIISSSAYSLSNSDTFVLRQPIEGFNTADLAWGTANAKTVTLSAWVYSSLTGTFGGSINNSNSTRSYPFSFTISSANTWTQISVTIAGDTTGTWVGATNGSGMFVSFSIAQGSNYQGTAGTWAGSALYGPTGTTNVLGTNGATFYITGVQLEVGSSATGFEYRQYGQELQLCQRYYYSITGNGGYLGTMQCYGSGSFFGKALDLPVTMRAIPTSTATGSWATNNASGGGQPFTTPTSFYNSTQSISFLGTGASGLSAGNATGVNFSSGNTLTASAEL